MGTPITAIHSSWVFVFGYNFFVHFSHYTEMYTALVSSRIISYLVFQKQNITNENFKD